LPTTNATWAIKRFEDADVHLVSFKEKTKKLPLEFFSQVLMTSSKNPVTPAHSWPHPQKRSNRKMPVVFLIEDKRLSAF